MAARLTGSAPVLLVKDVFAARDYFRDKLGFEDTELYGEPPTFSIVRSDGLAVMLAQKPEGAKHKANWRIVDKMWNAYFWVDDAEGLYAEMQRRGAVIDYSIYTTPWGTREFGVQDLDEHDIAFGQVLEK